jgi:hypothetical protein
MRFTEPELAKVLIEEDVFALRTLSRLLNHYGTMEQGDPVYINDITKASFLSLAKTLELRVNECTCDYAGAKYIIMAKGRRRLRFGLKREPDLYIGSEYGTNFFEACQFYFMFHSKRNKFNEKNLTYYGRTLFGLPAKDISNYATGIKTTGKGFSVWFTLSNQTYTLACEDDLGNAELQLKMLNRTFQNLMTLKNTKQQHTFAK